LPLPTVRGRLEAALPAAPSESLSVSTSRSSWLFRLNSRIQGPPVNACETPW
jgi:hypothetical protein